MLPNAIPLAGIPITTPDATPEAALKNNGLSDSLPFKDLLLELQAPEGGTSQPSSALNPDAKTTPDTGQLPGLQAAEGRSLQQPNALDFATTNAAPDTGKSTGLTFLVASDDGVPLPIPQSAQDGSNKSNISQVSLVPQTASGPAEKDATLPDGKPQANCPLVTQANVDEPQVAIAPSVAKESISGKSDRKTGNTDNSVPAKGKLSLKRIVTSAGSSVSVPAVPTEVIAMKVSSATIDPNMQTPSAQAAPVMNSMVAGWATKLLQETATVKAGSVKWPVAMVQSTSPKSEATDQVNQVVAGVLSATDDPDASHDAVAIESTPKIAHAAGLREPSFVPATPQPAAVFHASLTREVKSTGSLTASDDEPSLTAAEPPVSSAVGAPVNHLDLQWKDGTLGNVSVRAEMREGVLHAVVNSSHVSSAVSPTELHQFLEESRIPVHSLQVNGVEGVKHISEAGPFDANTAAGNGAQSSLSYRDESSRSSARGQETRNKANDADEVEPTSVSAVPMTHSVQPQMNRLSIHI